MRLSLYPEEIKMFKATGIIRIEPRFMFLECDREISRYYRRLARFQNIDLVSQRHDSHISVIRTEELSNDLPKNYENEIVEFCGNPEYMQYNSRHYWFRIISPRLEEIRINLGFCSQPIEILDNGRVHTHPFHLTIGRIAGTF